MHNIFKVRRNDFGWKQWFDKDAPEESAIPDGYDSSLDTFRKLLLVRWEGVLFILIYLIYCGKRPCMLNANPR